MQQGWDSRSTSDKWELTPLTRPYGLEPGMVFQVAAVSPTNPEGKWQNASGTLVEVERYHDTPPKDLPPDEQRTRAVKTDPGGVATCTLTESGWWAITANHDAPEREREGKKYPVKRRETLWVFVDEEPGAESSGDRSASVGSPGSGEHKESFPIRDVLTGIGLLIAAAAFIMSVRNAPTLRQLLRSAPQKE
jgi:hypothetical protein